MNRIISDLDGNEWEFVLARGGAAQVSHEQAAADDQFVTYEACLVGHPEVRKQFAVPRGLNLDDAFVQRSLFARDASDLG